MKIRNSKFGIGGGTCVHTVGAGVLDGPLVRHGRGSTERSWDRSLRGNVRPHRRGRRPRRPACRTWVHVGGRFVNRPYGSTPSVSGGRYTPLTPPPEGEARLLRRAEHCSAADPALAPRTKDAGFRRRGGARPRPLWDTGAGRRSDLGIAPYGATPSVSGTPSAPVCALGHTQGPRRGRQGCFVGPSIARPRIRRLRNRRAADIRPCGDGVWTGLGKNLF